MPQFRDLAVALACVVSSCPAAASDLAGCAAIDDDRGRLACYDTLAGRRQDGTRATPATSQTAGTADRAGPATAIDGSPESPARELAPGAEDEFGLSEASKKARDPDRYAASRPESITRQVTHAARDPYDRFVVTLDNGQVWVQNEGRSGIYPRPGESVTITQGSLGGYALRSERFGTVRVRRVK